MSTTEETAASLLSESKPGPIERIQLRASEVKGAAMRAVSSVMKSMGMRDPERGPTDYDEEQDERQLLWSVVRELRKNGGYHEAPKDSGLKAVIIGCTITILSAGIIGAIVFSNEFAAFRAQVTEWQKSTDRRLEILEKRP